MSDQRNTDFKVASQARTGIWEFGDEAKADLLQALFTSPMEHSFVVKDLEHRIIAWNRGAENNYGYSAGEVLGQPAAMLFDPSVPHDEVVRFQTEAKEHGVAVREFLRRRKDGTTFPARVTLSRIDDGDEATGFLLVSHNLEAERARDQERIRLAIERDSARESAKMRSQFLANMSHEIRTPLNAIVGMATVLADVIPAPLKHYVDAIRSSSRHLLALVSDILDLSKVDADRMQLFPEPTVLMALCEDCVELVLSGALDKGLELITDFEDLPVAAELDGPRTIQVLTNLLNNAIKFTDSGSVTFCAAQDGDVLRFTIEDTGPGIPDERIPDIFEKFLQLENGNTRRGGAGLGLPIAKRIVDLMGGTIEVDSEIGNGTAFVVRIPLVEAQIDGLPDWLTNGKSLQGLRALVVDDDEVNLAIYAHMLRRWQVEATTTSSPTEALELARCQTFDLALLDYRMPGMNGVELGKGLRECSPKLPLLLISSAEPSKVPQRLFVNILSKPLRHGSLFDAMIRASSAQVRADACGTASEFDSELADRQPLSVLVVEDNAVNATVIRLYLQRFGYDPMIAADGLEAVAKCENHRFDLVLMDVQLPIMDGLEATRRIKARHPAIRVVGLSAHVGPEDRSACLEAGMTDYLSKPLAVPALRQALVDAWSGLSAQPEPTSSA